MSQPTAFPVEDRLTFTLQVLSQPRTDRYLTRKLRKLNLDELDKGTKALFKKFQKYFEDNTLERPKPRAYAQAIVACYNHYKAKKKPFEAWSEKGKIEGEQEGIPPFKVSSYYCVRKSKAIAAKALGAPDKEVEQDPNNSRSIFLVFLARSWKKELQRRDEVAILTTDWGWKIVRKCIDYPFPIRAAQKLSSFDRILACERVSLIQPSHIQSFRQKDDVALYGMDWLHFKYMHFRSLIKTDSPLSSLPFFEDAAEKVVLNVGEGTLRIQHKLNIPEWAQVFHILFDIHQKASSEASQDPNPEFEYLLLVGPAEIEKSKLEETFLRKLLQVIRRNDFEGFSLGHKRDQDFLQAGIYKLTLQSGKGKKTVKEWKGAVPGLKEIFSFYHEQNPKAFSSEEVEKNVLELKQLLKGRLEFPKEYLKTDGSFSKPTLLNLIHGSVYVEGRTYFRFRKMWLQTSGEHYAITQEVFLGLLRRVYHDDWPFQLPIAWSGVHDKGELTQTVLSKALGIKNGVKDLFESLKKQKAPYLEEKNKVVQKKLIGDILQNPVVQKHKEKIEEWLASGEADLGKFIPKEDVNEVLDKLKISYDIFRDLQASKQNAKNHEWVVVHPWLPSDFGWPASLSVRTKEIEERALKIIRLKIKDPKFAPNQKTLKEKLDLKKGQKPLYHSLPEAGAELPEDFSIPDEVEFGVNPQTQTDLSNLLKQLYQRHISWKRESQYNQLYLDYPLVQQGEGWLTGDCVTPQNVELFDLIHYTPEDLLLYAVKEELGQKTREAVSQLIVSAKKLRAALDHPQSKNIIEAFWDKAVGEHTGPNAGYLNKLKDKLLNQLGKAGFWELFTRRKITFVYACLAPSNLNNSLGRERNLRTFCMREDLKQFKDSQWDEDSIYNFLIQEEFLDKRGRLTAKFAALENGPNISDIPFSDPLPEKAHEITLFLQDNFLTGSASIIAKLELMRAEKELLALGFNFAIVEIPRLKDDMQEASQSETPSSSIPPLSSSLSSQTKSPIKLSSYSQSPAGTPLPERPNSGFPNNLESNANLTNICYVNAFMQIILNTPSLNGIVKKVAPNSIGTPEAVLSWICHEKHPPRQGPERLRDRLRATKKWPTEEEKWQQQDVHELLIKFEELFKELKISVTSERRAEKKNDQVRPETNQQLDLCVEIPEQKDPASLQDLVDQVFNWSPREDTQDPWRYDALAKSFNTWEEKSTLNGKPQIIILRLLRHKFDKSTLRDGKILTPLSLPDKQIVNFPSGKYRIAGIIFHRGGSLAAGHYMALVSWENKGWFHCDDDKVTKLNAAQLAKQAEQGYLIICEKLEEQEGSSS